MFLPTMMFQTHRQNPQQKRWGVLIAGLSLAASLAVASNSEASGAGATHDHATHKHAQHVSTAHDHSAHGESASPVGGYSRESGNYDHVPDVRLRDSQGKEILLAELLAEDRPVLMQFIFTSCATICPMLSAIFSQAQSDIAAVGPAYRMISISIDPEYDTPKRLAAFAQRYKADAAHWTFLTGSKSDIGKVMRSFDVLYQADNKMYHQPYTFIRARSGTSWLKIDGLLSARELVQEYRSVLIQADVALR